MDALRDAYADEDIELSDYKLKITDNLSKEQADDRAGGQGQEERQSVPLPSGFLLLKKLVGWSGPIYTRHFTQPKSGSQWTDYI